VGEKIGTLIMAFGQFAGGIIIGFAKGPLYALALLGIGPPMVIVITISINLMVSGSAASLKAYG
jgi:hypothetical protein